MVIFQYNLYIFVLIEHDCLTNMVYAMDPNNSVIKRLLCTFNEYSQSNHNICFQKVFELGL